MKRYLKVLAWVAGTVGLLTAGQYGCVHLMTGRPSSWLFEVALDFGPPLLFAGDMIQVSLNHGWQAPLRDQPWDLAAGMLANIALYGTVALVLTWLFFPPPRRPAAVRPARQISAAKQRKLPPRRRR